MTKTNNKRIGTTVYYAINAVFWFLFYYKLVVINNGGDYYWHNKFAEWLFQGEYISYYPGYQIIIGGISKLLHVNLLLVSTIVLTLVSCGILWLTKLLIEEISEDRIGKQTYYVLAILCMIIQPIILPGFAPGYSSGNGYVSPTYTMCRPFILLSVLLFFKMYKDGKFTRKRQALLAVSLISSCIVKPLFAMAFIPAMGILLLFDGIKQVKAGIQVGTVANEFFHQIIPFIICGIVLIIQFWSQQFCFAPVDSSNIYGHLAIGFFSSWKLVVNNVFISIVFAYLFPICLSIYHLVNRKKVGQSIKCFLRISAFYGVISFSIFAFVYQTGYATIDCNFRNCWIVTFTLVYIVCTVMLANDWKSERVSNQGSPIRNKGLLFVSSVYALQILFGVLLIGKNFLV